MRKPTQAKLGWGTAKLLPAPSFARLPGRGRPGATRARFERRGTPSLHGIQMLQASEEVGDFIARILGIVHDDLVTFLGRIVGALDHALLGIDCCIATE